jgi:hypothetical protein
LGRMRLETDIRRVMRAVSLISAEITSLQLQKSVKAKEQG